MAPQRIDRRSYWLGWLKARAEMRAGLEATTAELEGIKRDVAIELAVLRERVNETKCELHRLQQIGRAVDTLEHGERMRLQ